MDSKQAERWRAQFAAMSDHDNLTELRVEMKSVQEVLKGNGGPGICQRVDSLEESRTTHKVYFALMAGALIVGLPLLTWLAEHWRP